MIGKNSFLLSAVNKNAEQKSHEQNEMQTFTSTHSLMIQNILGFYNQLSMHGRVMVTKPYM